MTGASDTAEDQRTSKTDESLPFLSIIIPAYNESRRLPKTLETIRTYLSQCRLSPLKDRFAEVIVVDDGSTDGTPSVASSFHDQFPYLRVFSYRPNRGKGHAVKTGMLAAKGQYLLFTDADLSTPVGEVEKLLSAVTSGPFAIAIGSRALPGSELIVRQPVLREWMGRAFNLAVQLLALPGIWDSQCGFKLFSRDAAHRVFSLQRLNGFAFDVEVLFIARRLGFKIAEVPVVWRNDPETKVRAFRDGIRMLADVLRIRLYHLCGLYGS